MYGTPYYNGTTSSNSFQKNAFNFHHYVKVNRTIKVVQQNIIKDFGASAPVEYIWYLFANP